MKMVLKLLLIFVLVVHEAAMEREQRDWGENYFILKISAIPRRFFVT